MRKKLICIDVDGTLIGNNAEISKQVQREMRRMRRDGYQIAFCSGRCMADLKFFDKEKELADYYIGFNGALCENQEEVIFSYPIQEETLRTIINMFSEKGVMPTLCSVNEYYFGENKVEQERRFIDYLESQNKRVEEFLNVKRFYVADDDGWKRIIDENSKKIFKIEVVKSDEMIAEAMRQIAVTLRGKIEYSLFDGKAYHVPPHYEITSAGVDKAYGIRELQHYLGLDREEIVAIGDGENDLPAFRYAGTAIAMGNAAPKVKAAADYIAGMNTEDGIMDAFYWIQSL